MKQTLFLLCCMVTLAWGEAPSLSGGSLASKIPIKIGATLALSGPLAFMGEAERQGLELALEEINARGGVNGRPLELIVEDNQGEAKVAVNSVMKLLTVDKVDVMFSAFTHVTQAIKGVVARNNKVLLYESAQRKIAEENPLFFRDYYDAFDSGVAIAQAVQTSAISKVAFLSEINDACMSYQEGVSSRGKELGLEITKTVEYAHGETDFRSLLLSATVTKPQALVLCTWRDSAEVMKQMAQLGLLKLPTFHFVAPNLPSSDTREMRELYEKNKTVSSWYGFTFDTSDAKQLEFLKTFEKKFGSKPRSDSAFTYDDLYILQTALKPCSTANSVDANCLARELLKTDYNGVAGHLTFSANRLSNRKVLLIQVKNGEWVEWQGGL